MLFPQRQQVGSSPFHRAFLWPCGTNGFVTNHERIGSFEVRGAISRLCHDSSAAAAFAAISGIRLDALLDHSQYTIRRLCAHWSEVQVGSEAPRILRLRSTLRVPLDREIIVLVAASPISTSVFMASANASADRWWTEKTVAVVTGSNKGIGLDIVRKLAQEGLTVVLAARDEERGLKAAQELHAEGLKNVVFRQLDISEPTSVTAFVDWIKQTYGGLDILVNNAAVLHMDNVYENAKESIDINYFGTKNLTEQLFPLFKASPAGGRIVNLSSTAGWLVTVNDEELRQRLIDPSTFDQETIDKLANQYKEVCKSGNESAAAGFGSAYTFSKVLGNAYTRLLAQRALIHSANRRQASTVYVNCVNPGMVDTGMFAKFRSSVDDASFGELQKRKVLEDKLRTTSMGADTPVWLALYPPGGPSGRFWFDRRELSYIHGDA